MKRIISIVGDRDVEKGSKKWNLAYSIAEKIVDEGYRIMTGGVGTLAEAVYMGAMASKNHTDGTVIAVLPGFDSLAAEKSADIAITTGLDEYRNLIVANSDALVAIGGGAGTLSEISFAWSLKRLVICLQTDGWSGELAGKRIDHRTRYQNIKEDRCFPAGNAEEVFQTLSEYIDRYDKRHKGIPNR